MRLGIRRALFTASDKREIERLAASISAAGGQLVATGKTQAKLESHGLPVTPIERITGNPESFSGRMKTLSFPVCSGILYRRGNSQDEADVQALGIPPIDCVVVNFYPFEEVLREVGQDDPQRLIENIDIGGPTLLRAAAKNVPHVLVLTHPSQYDAVIEELETQASVSEALIRKCASEAWKTMAHYDQVIADALGSGKKKEIALRYGENSHQQACLQVEEDAPLRFTERLTKTELSYNNVLDLNSGYELVSDLKKNLENYTAAVVLKHNNPCGVGVVPKNTANAQLRALELAWQGDPVSAFGGVVHFSDPLHDDTWSFFSDRFIELIAAPGLFQDDAHLQALCKKRKKLKAIRIDRFSQGPEKLHTQVPGGVLTQTADRELADVFDCVTESEFDWDQEKLARFGILVCKSLRSNAIAIVREASVVPGSMQLIGAGQGQPNRVDAVKRLAIPRAKSVLNASGGSFEDCLLISDAFFPFRDAIETIHEAGIRTVVQPGGSIKDEEVIEACNELGVAMLFTGVRHFKH